MRITAAAVLGLLLLTTSTAHAAYGDENSLFAPGRVRFSGNLGTGSAFGETYFIVGLGAGVYVLHGLELGASVDQWFGPGPNVTRVAPEARYVFDFIDVVKPFVGGFFRHWFITQGARDLDTAGGRAGLMFVQSRNFYFSAGVAYERVINSCQGDCDFWVPEIGAAFSF